VLFLLVIVAEAFGFRFFIGNTNEPSFIRYAYKYYIGLHVHKDIVVIIYIFVMELQGGLPQTFELDLHKFVQNLIAYFLHMYLIILLSVMCLNLTISILVE